MSVITIPTVPKIRYSTIDQPLLVGFRVKSKYPIARSKIISRRGWRKSDRKHFRADGVMRIKPTNRTANDFAKALAEKVRSSEESSAWIRENFRWMSVLSASELWIYFIFQGVCCGALKTSIKTPVRAKIHRQICFILPYFLARLAIRSNPAKQR